MKKTYYYFDINDLESGIFAISPENLERYLLNELNTDGAGLSFDDIVHKYLNTADTQLCFSTDFNSISQHYRDIILENV